MALPQVGGSHTLHYSGGNSPVIDISDVPNGAWMVASAMSGASSTIVTAPAGWTILESGVTTGTRRNYLFAKIREASDGSSATFNQNGTNQVSYALLWGTGGSPISNWTMGTGWLRGSNSVQPTGARYDNIARSITTTVADTLVVTISHEATNAYVQPMEVTSVTSGWQQRLYVQQAASNDRIETIWMGTKELAAPGTSGDATITYVSPQDNNGWALQIGIPNEPVQAPSTPQVVGSPTTVVVPTAGSGFSLARPSGVTLGDYIIVAVRGQMTLPSDTIASPGFARLGPAFVSSATYRTTGFFGHAVTNMVTEPSSYDFTLSGSSGRLLATAIIVRGVDLDNPISGYFNSYGGTTVTNGRRVDSYTLDEAPALGLFLGGSEFTSPNNHVPTALPAEYTNVVSLTTDTNLGVSRTYLWLGRLDLATSPTNDSIITWDGASGASAQGIALRGSGAGPITGPGLTLSNGNGDPVQIYYTTADGPKTPSEVTPMRPGFSSVSDMLRVQGHTWAHRGGSTSWPEMSLYAYTRSVLRGYGALEVSLARTSDGVWFGLHDQTTDRTSGGTYGNASSQTWAQIQAQQITIGGQGAPQPYMRWEEIVATYGDTHIIIADPKYALGGYRTEFLNMVNNDLGPSRAIVKYSGGGSGAALLSTQAQALGFETWGFYYAADASASLGGSGALQTWGPSWTLIGMEHGASQEVWNEALALGKPVIGHIASNQTQYNTAIAKGATGVQTSGVAVVNPVSWWTAPEYPTIVGTTTTSRTGSGNLTVPLPSQSGGCYMILLVGDNAPTQPTTPAGWTLVNWSTGNPELNMGIYTAPSGTAAPTFTLAQSHNGGFVATAFRFNVEAVDITGSGGSNTLTSNSMTATKPGLVIWSLSGVLEAAPPATYTYPTNAPRWRNSIISAGTEGGVALGVAAAIVPTASSINSVTWGLDNQSTVRAGGFLITVADLPDREHLIAEYGFNEPSGSDITDSSGNGYTLTLGTNTSRVVGHSGTGISTTGTTGDGAHRSTFSNPTTSGTLMGWVYPRNVSGEIPLFGFWSGPDANPNGSSQFNMYASRTAVGPNGVLNASLRVNGTLNTVTGSTMTLNTWQHVAVTFNGSTATLYLNGQSVQSTPMAGTLGVGYFNVVGVSDASVDDVRVFNTALTQAEIARWMNRSV